MSHFHMVGLALCLAGALGSQDLGWSLWSTPVRQLYGGTKAVGDLDGDGHEDLVTLVGSTACSSTPISDWGGLWAISGASGAFLYEYVPPLLGGTVVRFLAICPAGDWNQDGVADFATSQQGSALAVVVHSGIDGTPLFSVPPPLGGAYALAVCDVNGDGWQDIIMGEEEVYNYWGNLRVVDHFGSTLYQISGQGLYPIGRSLAVLGDIDDDGCDDFVVGCAHFYGANVILSGRTGAVLRTCFGEMAGDMLFRTMDNCGDVDGDGYEDFVVGSGVTGAYRRGMVIFSSRTGQVIRSWYPGFISDFGKQVVGRGVDFDGDGVPDVMTGSYLQNVSSQQSGAIYVFSGRDGTRIHRLASSPVGIVASGNVGLWFTALRPPAGERFGTLVATDRGALNFNYCPIDPQQGMLRAYRTLPRTASTFGAGCAGNLARAPEIGLQAVAQSVPSAPLTAMRVHLSDAPAGVPAVLLLGVNSNSTWNPGFVALDSIGLGGCQLWVPIDLMFVGVTGPAGPDAGYLTQTIPLPVPLQGNGTWWLAAQWLVLGGPTEFPGGLSEAVRWRR